jgi:hypothetical protein
VIRSREPFIGTSRSMETKWEAHRKLAEPAR